MTARVFGWIFLIALLMPQLASASTFCVRQQGGVPQCLYEDAADCRRRATEINGLCSVNPRLVSITATGGRYCVVTSERATECYYPERAACETEARRKGAVCIDSAAVPAQPDPHGEDPERRY
jgi:hypothetical protein